MTPVAVLIAEADLHLRGRAGGDRVIATVIEVMTGLEDQCVAVGADPTPVRPELVALLRQLADAIEATATDPG